MCWCSIPSALGRIAMVFVKSTKTITVYYDDEAVFLLFNT